MLEERIKQLEQDMKDLLEFADARRCLNCDRYYPTGFICVWCGTDNSLHPDYEEE